MKTTLCIITALLVSCSNPADNQRLGQLVDLALTVAVAKNKITAQDAQAIRDAKTIVLPDEVAPSGK